MQNPIILQRHLTPVSKQAYLHLFDKYLGAYFKVNSGVDGVDYQNKTIDVYKLSNEVVISQLKTEQLTVELVRNNRHMFYTRDH